MAGSLVGNIVGVTSSLPSAHRLIDLESTISATYDCQRPRASGKFLFVGNQKLYVRGATYGAFRSHSDGKEYHDLDQVRRDFALLAANGFNAVSIPHTLPPRDLLDVAQQHGLFVMVRLSAEQYIGCVVDRKMSIADVEAAVRERARGTSRHPALLAYALGNEIAAPLVRWLGRHTVERLLSRLYRTVKAEDPGALVTYVNYPTTEYLQLSFLDFVCFNIYPESQNGLEAYTARLHNLTGARPLLIGAVGKDSLRKGPERPSHILDSQVRTAFASGCAGAFLHPWTDDWNGASREGDHQPFGLREHDRRGRLGVTALREAFAHVPFSADASWPKVSVVVCSYNGAGTIRGCLEALRQLDYPDFEVLVVDDGSTDATGAIAAEYNVRVLVSAHAGLGSARNSGFRAARGEIVAYIDDDAYPDPHWLRYLATCFQRGDFIGVGGPNLPPPEDGIIAEAVANAPGGPDHVLLTDTVAEHIPGCNMAFRKDALERIDGFDPRFRSAGDDVDLCWRLQERGWKLGFSPAAVVWHHRRSSVRGYWQQQVGYGRAEALLERKWPEKYNSAGHVHWSGRMYTPAFPRLLAWTSRIYHGTWGTAPFQSIDQLNTELFASLPLMPEWYLLIVGLAALSALGIVWGPLLFALPLLIAAVAVSGIHTLLQAITVRPARQGGRGPMNDIRYRALIGLLHLLQPLARLTGRLRSGLGPWRWRGSAALADLRPRSWVTWTNQWRPPDERLRAVKATLQVQHARVLLGGPHDRWDLETRGGMFGAARLLIAVEDHGAGPQLIRARSWPRCLPRGVGLVGLFGTLAVAAGLDQAWVASIVLAAITLTIGLRMLRDCCEAAGSISRALVSANASDG
jgi:O-antigen biosynthesis protein